MKRFYVYVTALLAVLALACAFFSGCTIPKNVALADVSAVIAITDRPPIG